MLLTNIVIAVATAVYAWINFRLLKESQETRKQKTAPFVVAFLKTTDNHNVLSLHIKNIGEGLAKNVQITVLKDYFIMKKDKYPISNLNIVKNGINIFPPQYEFVNNIDWLIESNEDKKDKYIELSINYEGTDGRKFQEVFNLPFYQYLGQHYCNPPETYIGEIAYYLKEINTNIKKIQ
jgi:hypothetical protein